MKRREFLKTSLLLAAVSTVVGKATGIFTNALAAGAGAYPDDGPKYLGFQTDSKKKPEKLCGNCKHFAANKDAGPNAGECILPAMKKAVEKNKQAKVAFVKTGSYCNMWAKK